MTIQGRHSKEWNSVVAARDAYLEALRAIPYDELAEVLKCALDDRESVPTALSILATGAVGLVDEVAPALYRLLLSMSSPIHGARRAILRLPPDRLSAHLAALVKRVIEDPASDYEPYRCLEGLLLTAGELGLLAALVAKARESDDPDLLEFADDATTHLDRDGQRQ